MRPAKDIERHIKNVYADGLKVTTSADLDERVLDNVMETLDELEKKESAAIESNIWRLIMKSRITKLATAAVIIIAVMVGINQFRGSLDIAGVAWGKVVEKVEQIESFIFQHKMNIKGAAGMPEGTTVDIESTIYVSSEYGLRQDQYIGGKAVGVNYVPPSGTIITSLLPHMKKYIKASVTEEQIRNMHEEVNPIGMIKAFMSFEHTELGREIIDGVKTEGIEVDDPKFLAFMFENAKGRLWVDVKTGLPVRFEVEGVSGDGVIETKVVAYEFDWDAELEPSVFEPNIPDDYTLHGEIDISDNEGAAIKGLRIFAELVGGLYPRNLDLMTASLEASKAVQAEIADDPNWDPNMPVSKEQIEKTTVIQATCRFYAKIIEDYNDVVYYGEKITPEDSDLVLLRWKISDTEYRVIFGDLTAENVSAEQLAELENDSDFIRIMSETRKRPQYEIASEFIGHQADEWHINNPNKITINSNITLIRWPEETSTMEITLPYLSGVIESVTFGETELQYSGITQGRYNLELPQINISLSEKKIEIVWTLPLEKLEKDDWGYQTVLRSLIPVHSYSLTTILEEDCGFEYTKEPSKRRFVPFTWTSFKAKRDFGSSGFTIQKIE
jgi:hypothetical protein